jgi:hypothetical protein
MGSFERFNRTILDKLFRIAFREHFYETVDALQHDLDVWLLTTLKDLIAAIETEEKDRLILS